MARVAFLIERLPPHADPIGQMAYGLILQLAEQQHEIQIYSTYRERDDLPPPHPRIEILRPLRKWNWLEVPRLLAMMLDFKPEILHVIDPHAESLEGYTNALRAIPGLIPLMNHPKLALSFFDVHAPRIEKLKFLIEAANLITVTNRAQLQTILKTAWQTDQVSKQSIGRRVGPQTVDADSSTTEIPSQLRLLPSAAHRAIDRPRTIDEMGLGVRDTISFNETSPLERFLHNHRDFIFLPGDLDLHEDLEKLLPLFVRILQRFESSALIFGGGWGSIGSMRRRSLMSSIEESGVGARVFITGPLDASAELRCFSACRYASFVSLPDGTLAFTQALQRGLLGEAVLVLNKTQAERDALPWKHGENAMIASNQIQDWEPLFVELLTSDEKLTAIHLALKDFAREQTLDQPGNIMSRWYNEILMPRELGSDAHT